MLLTDSLTKELLGTPTVSINSYLKIMNEKVTMAPKTCYVSFKMYIKVRKSILFASQFSDSFEQSRLNRITHWKINERSS